MTESDSLALPISVDMVGAHLVVLDDRGARKVRVFRSRDGALVASFGREGGGPGEFQAVRHTDPVAGSATEFWVFDSMLRRLTRYDLARDTLDPSAAGKEGVTLPPGPLPLAVRRTQGGTMIATGIFTPGRLGVYGADGRLLRTVGEIPGKDGKTPERVLQHAYSGTLVADPGRTRLALANRHADRLELYGADGSPRGVARVRDGFGPVFEVHSSRGVPYMASGEDMRFGYIDAAATDDAVYGLFSGVRRMDRPGRAAFGDRVYVFDWQGRVKQVVKLDALAIAIAVDPSTSTLYTIRHDPTPAILRYPLPRTGAAVAAR